MRDGRHGSTQRDWPTLTFKRRERRMKRSSTIVKPASPRRFPTLRGGVWMIWPYAQSGQHDRAIETLEDLYVRPGAYGLAALVHVMYASDLLGDDPRYQALLEEAGITW